MSLYELFFSSLTFCYCIYNNGYECSYFPFTDNIIPLCDIRNMCIDAIELGF